MGRTKFLLEDLFGLGFVEYCIAWSLGHICRIAWDRIWDWLGRVIRMIVWVHCSSFLLVFWTGKARLDCTARRILQSPAHRQAFADHAWGQNKICRSAFHNEVMKVLFKSVKSLLN